MNALGTQVRPNKMLIIDKLSNALIQRLCQCPNSAVFARFVFLIDLTNLSANTLKEQFKNVRMAYSEDIESSLKDEMVHFSAYLKIQVDKFVEQYSDQNYSKELLIYKLIIDYGLKEAFPNVEITFLIYFSLIVSDCAGEKRFSKLSRIKNILRSTMTHNRLNNLSLMSKERDI